MPLHVLLLLDNATCHPKSLVSRHPNVRVEFLPANTTSLMQPLDQEVISSAKVYYQMRVYRQLVVATDSGVECQRLEEEVSSSSSSSSEVEEEESEEDGLPDLSPVAPPTRCHATSAVASALPLASAAPSRSLTCHLSRSRTSCRIHLYSLTRSISLSRSRSRKR